MFDKSSDAVAQLKCAPRRPPQTAPVEQGAPGWPEGEVSRTQLAGSDTGRPGRAIG